MHTPALAETIFAPASPVQKSGVAIIRISGEKAGETLTLLTKNPLPNARKAILTGIFDPASETLLDRALVLWFPAPASFTGEDVAELHVHGSIAVISSLLDALSKIEGLRLASPGEFSRRAFENNKMDLTEAEGLADLIEAETSLQAQQALQQMDGSLHTLYGGWRKNLIHMQALLEAYIDFPEEEIPKQILFDIQKTNESLQHNIRTHLTDNHRGERLRRGMQVVILGPPNAGKSSLLNHLAKREVAIVSDIAGTTRDILDVHLDIGGYPITLSDTAGLREEAEIIEQEGIRRALKRAEEADVTLLLLDISMPKAQWQPLITQAGEDAVIVFNKVDLLQENSRVPAIEGKSTLGISIAQQEGIESLLQALEERAKTMMGGGKGDAPVVTRTRHRQLLHKTLASLEHFNPQHELELAAEDLRAAAHLLGQIIGRIDVEDILDELFGQFCIGK